MPSFSQLMDPQVLGGFVWPAVMVLAAVVSWFAYESERNDIAEADRNGDLERTYLATFILSLIGLAILIWLVFIKGRGEYRRFRGFGGNDEADIGMNSEAAAVGQDIGMNDMSDLVDAALEA